MASMTISSTGLPRGRTLTADDLAEMPDDGHRYELIDGTLVVTPGPSWAHQSVQARLLTLLYAACPPDLRVLGAPFEVRFSESTAVQPDLLVARYTDITSARLPVAPLLAVEVRSPSTALVDLNLKRAAYERHGVASYWLVDPDRQAPTVTVLELTDGHYVERGTATGAERLAVEAPFPFVLEPADLLRDL